ncbi:hypothetical protein [Intestinibacter bartlettii]|nr:hypothetical protein [Intestinibacter bartlettii]
MDYVCFFSMVTATIYIEEYRSMLDYNKIISSMGKAGYIYDN